MHFSMLVLTDREIADRDSAQDEAERLLDPHREDYDADADELTGHWDWWVIGGRWTGTLTGYDPKTDQRNYETCTLCGGTGTRADADRFDQAWREWSHGCNGCMGKGFARSWSYAPHDGDIMPVADLNGGDWPSMIAGVVTPDGEWHGGLMTDTPDEKIRELVAAHPNATAIVVDCHS